MPQTIEDMVKSSTAREPKDKAADDSDLHKMVSSSADAFEKKTRAQNQAKLDAYIKKGPAMSISEARAEEPPSPDTKTKQVTDQLVDFGKTLTSNLASAYPALWQQFHQPVGDTIMQLLQMQGEAGVEAVRAGKQVFEPGRDVWGRIGSGTEAVGHGFGWAIPLVGPMINIAINDMIEGKYGKGAADLTTALFPEIRKRLGPKFGLGPGRNTPVERARLEEFEKRSKQAGTNVRPTLGVRAGQPALTESERLASEGFGGGKIREAYTDVHTELERQARESEAKISPTAPAVKGPEYQAGQDVYDKHASMKDAYHSVADQAYDNLRAKTAGARVQLQNGWETQAPEWDQPIQPAVVQNGVYTEHPTTYKIVRAAEKEMKLRGIDPARLRRAYGETLEQGRKGTSEEYGAYLQNYLRRQGGASLMPMGPKVPKMEWFEAPVDIRQIQKDPELRKIYKELDSSWSQTKKDNNPGFQALKNVMNEDNWYMDAMKFDKNLGSIKGLLRRNYGAQSSRIASAIIDAGEKEAAKAYNAVAPGTYDQLLKARDYVKKQYDVEAIMDKISPGWDEDRAIVEPQNVYNKVMLGDDKNFDLLKEMNQVAPKETKAAFRVWVSEMIGKAYKNGKLENTAGLVKEWDSMGPLTKELFLGKQNAQDLDVAFRNMKKLEPARGSPTASRHVVMGQIGAVAGGVGLAMAGQPGLGLWTALVPTLGPAILGRIVTMPSGPRWLRTMATATGTALEQATREGAILARQAQDEEDREKQGLKPKRGVAPGGFLPAPAGRGAGMGRPRAAAGTVPPARGGDLVPRLADAIQQQEGWYEGSRSQKNHNPGNIIPLPNQRIDGMVGRDKDGFAIFRDDSFGRKALEAQVSYQVGRGQNLYQFFAQYAPKGHGKNDPVAYADEVHRQLGIDPKRPLNELMAQGAGGAEGGQ